MSAPSGRVTTVDRGRVVATALQLLAWLLKRWPGRIVLRTLATSVRIEVFDRSMTIAAQFFTSVFPLVILASVWLGSDETRHLADTLGMPEGSQAVLGDALEGSSASFGAIGALIVLVSATSLSRALTRAYSAIWGLPRPKSRLRQAWRWVVVVVGMASSLVVVRVVTVIAEQVPPPHIWKIVLSVACDTVIMLLVPWLLLSGALPVRVLLPGALIYGLAMLIGRPASAVYLPRALDASADLYGSIGVAFTYLAWLYVVSFGVLVTAMLGQVISTDPGWLGRWIRGNVVIQTETPVAADRDGLIGLGAMGLSRLGIDVNSINLEESEPEERAEESEPGERAEEAGGG